MRLFGWTRAWSAVGCSATYQLLDAAYWFSSLTRDQTRRTPRVFVLVGAGLSPLDHQEIPGTRCMTVGYWNWVTRYFSTLMFSMLVLVLIWFSWSNIHTVDTHKILHTYFIQKVAWNAHSWFSQGHSQSLTLAKSVSERPVLADQDSIPRNRWNIEER